MKNKKAERDLVRVVFNEGYDRYCRATVQEQVNLGSLPNIKAIVPCTQVDESAIDGVYACKKQGKLEFTN